MRSLFSLLLVFTLVAAPVMAAETQKVVTQKTTEVKKAPVKKTVVKKHTKTVKKAAVTPAAKPTTVEVSPIYDPLEPFNRAVFGFNKFIDFLILKPVTTVYTTITPDPVQHGVTHVLSNLGEPINMLNSALQGNWNGLGVSFERFVINSTVGVLGVVDVASRSGYEKVDADFGQTLGKWGAGHGAYLVLPIIGPSSVRDGAGRLVDTVSDPYNIAFNASDTEWPIWTRYGATVIDTRARYGAEYDRTMKTAVDPYVTFRSIYAQRRAYVVQSGSSKPAADPYSAAENQ